MAKTTKSEKAATAALDAAAAAAKDAKRLSKALPKKDARKLRSFADEAKDASQVSKKEVARHPRKVRKKAEAAIARVEKAAEKAKGRSTNAKAAAVNHHSDAPANRQSEATARKATKAGKKHNQSARSMAAPPLGQPLTETFLGVAVEPAAVDVGEPVEPTEPAVVDLGALTVVQLRDRARAAGHTGFSRSNKAQLLALLSS